MIAQQFQKYVFSEIKKMKDIYKELFSDNHNNRSR